MGCIPDAFKMVKALGGDGESELLALIASYKAQVLKTKE